ncbi:RNA polymerase sigma factor [Flagellimonas sp.]|uniref:RNA polymerase sigma factor n=1 Tax=Flagellimonas sp. TaxID=2058762 RepID=UPI003B508BA1
MKFQNDFVLIQYLKNGNEEAYVYLVDHFNNRLCTYASSLANDPLMAQDIVQQVFIKVWEKRNQLNANFPLSNFLHKSVYNEFIDQYRKKRAVTLLEKKYIDALNSIVEEEESHLDKRLVLVKQEIENLPPKCKQVFLMSKQDGLTNTEISEYLGISIKAVEWQITKAFSTIRERVKVKMQGYFFILFPMFGRKFKY